jgi:predicted PurR-regulated permease PerM
MSHLRPPFRTLLLGAFALILVYVLALGAMKLANLWMLIFGSIVFAVVLRSIADPLVRYFKIPDGAAVALAVLAVVAGLAAIGLLFGNRISSQVSQLSLVLPEAWRVLQARLEASPFAADIIEQLKALGSEAGRALALAPRIALTIASGITTLLLVLVAGVVLATQPVLAREGLLSMAPHSTRDRLREVLNACGIALKGWLRAQLVSMVLVGVLTGIGLWLIGVPAPLALGLFTGLAQFVPIVGPIASAVPALVIGAIGGTETFLLTLALYTAVSQLEANLITPLVQKNLAALPILLGIFAVAGLGILFGPLGVLFATPLALTIYTIVTMLYRQDVLHDADARAPGQKLSESPGDGHSAG